MPAPNKILDELSALRPELADALGRLQDTPTDIFVTADKSSLQLAKDVIRARPWVGRYAPEWTALRKGSFANGNKYSSNAV